MSMVLRAGFDKLHFILYYLRTTQSLTLVYNQQLKQLKVTLTVMVYGYSDVLPTIRTESYNSRSDVTSYLRSKLKQ